MDDSLQVPSEAEDQPAGSAPLPDSSRGHPDKRLPTQVLVADDDPVARESMSELLKDCGYDVIRVSNGTDALRRLQANDGPCLALLDWMMPDLDGTHICQQVRAAQTSRYVYMILVTARDDPKAVVEALNAGADDYIRKPFNPQELCARLDAGGRIIAQRALQESEERFYSAFECAGMGMAMTDLSGDFLQVNQTLCDFLGYSKEDLLKKNFQQITFPADLSENLLGLQQLISGSRKTYQTEKRYLQRDGSSVWAHVIVSLVRNADGRPAAFFAQIQDITERRHLEEQLRQAQKLEAIGQLAAGISHEINTPTQYVSDNTMFLKQTWPVIQEFICLARRMHEESAAGPLSPATISQFGAWLQKADVEYLLGEVPKAIEQSLEGVQRVAKIVRAMKEFSHPGSEEKSAIDINHAIHTTITVACNAWKYVSEVETNLDPNLPLVPGFAGGFNQVILNLLINAAQAIAQVVGDGSGGKGTILVTTRHLEDWVEISVSDTGSGIPEAIRARVFEPFFTTKPLGQGTGQGLALAHSLVREHGGRIWFDSEVGKGTTFFIRLPLALATAG
jgi:PAS domain S-box-containing protein